MNTKDKLKVSMLEPTRKERRRSVTDSNMATFLTIVLVFAFVWAGVQFLNFITGR
jgi:hypothetical protein